MYLELPGEKAIAKARHMVRTMKENDGANSPLRILVAIEQMQIPLRLSL
jgi:hypothetical protein